MTQAVLRGLNHLPFPGKPQREDLLQDCFSPSPLPLVVSKETSHCRTRTHKRIYEGNEFNSACILSSEDEHRGKLWMYSERRVASEGEMRRIT